MPLELASTIKAVCHVFAGSGPEERTYRPRPTIILFCFSLVREGDANSGRPTKFATSDCRWSKALFIENCKFDGRDSMVPLALLCHSAEKLGLNTNLLFTNAAQT